MGDADREGWRRLDGLRRQLRRHLLEGRSRQGGAAPAGGAMPAGEGGATPVGTRTLTLDEFFFVLLLLSREGRRKKILCSCLGHEGGKGTFFVPLNHLGPTYSKDS
jgi:hypothetical protein